MEQKNNRSIIDAYNYFKNHLTVRYMNTAMNMKKSQQFDCIKCKKLVVELETKSCLSWNCYTKILTRNWEQAGICICTEDFSSQITFPKQQLWPFSNKKCFSSKVGLTVERPSFDRLLTFKKCHDSKNDLPKMNWNILFLQK